MVNNKQKLLILMEHCSKMSAYTIYWYLWKRIVCVMGTTVKEKTAREKLPAKDVLIKIGNLLIKYNALAILVLLIIVSAIVSSKFLSWRNITTVLLQQVPYLIISMGVMLTIMTAGIDLSVAAVAGCANIFVAMLITQWGFSSVGMLFAAIALTLLLGCVFGALNGFFIGKLRMAPFIISLAMMSVAQGVTYIVSGGAQFRMRMISRRPRPSTGLPPTGIR